MRKSLLALTAIAAFAGAASTARAEPPLDRATVQTVQFRANPHEVFHSREWRGHEHARHWRHWHHRVW